MIYNKTTDLKARVGLKVIVTKQNPDGSYSECGTNNRRVISHLKTVRGAVKNAIRIANGTPIRCEVYPGGFSSTPCNWVLFYNAEGNRDFEAELPTTLANDKLK